MRVDAVNHGVRDATVRRGRQLEFFSIGWNLLEAAVGIGAGLFAGSIALIGFGIDSLIETTSGAVLLWRLQEGVEGEKRERRALKLVGLSFLALAVYVACEALKALLTRETPEKSIVGIVLAALSLVVMPLLARAKRRVAAKLSSRAMRADSRQTDICAYLSVILLAGLGLNVLFGWWWADPIAALGMLPIILKEGIEGLRGETCADCQSDSR
ncbi:MAG TPA: cation transporter [Thermodesulfobacteriota bacterium]|nr:cation transporter [Thermodesulfobacteriota bacterium]